VVTYAVKKTEQAWERGYVCWPIFSSIADLVMKFVLWGTGVVTPTEDAGIERQDV